MSFLSKFKKFVICAYHKANFLRFSKMSQLSHFQLILGDLEQIKVLVYFLSFKFHKKNFSLTKLKIRFLLIESLKRPEANAVITPDNVSIAQNVKFVQTNA